MNHHFEGEYSNIVSQLVELVESPLAVEAAEMTNEQLQWSWIGGGGGLCLYLIRLGDAIRARDKRQIFQLSEEHNDISECCCCLLYITHTHTHK